MSATITAVWTLWYDETTAKIEEAIAGSPDSDERRRRIEDVSAWIRSSPPGVQDAIRSAVDNAVQASKITQEEANRLLKP
jgi:hypothetical protein